ncbi:TatD family hydrolase [Gynuella sunshinyii]|uniref:Mg-dependent DNase n=1 Tax=Gynuella sunshinyii YC6258 TaxID=1445510 RepID=A0A0C5VUE7_9GAMM|nr:TatD family hydrolase [Gynuella sunshinyii]AJQ94034.1 Mg-dependent DNase [Gynuella sunshinyii YC6258]
MLIDSHCHLDFETFDSDRQRIIESCRQHNICGFMVPSVAPRFWPRQLRLASEYPEVALALGLHPWYVSEAAIESLRDLAKVLDSSPAPVLAIGETGLDKLKGNPELQLLSLKYQLGVAQELDKPVILHSVKTHARLQDILRDYPGVRGVVHGFSGSYEDAMRFIDIGFKVGIGGLITRPNARKIRAAVTRLPLHSMVLETDAPDMGLYGHEGSRNSPENLVLILNCLAELRQQDPESIQRAVLSNTRELFTWPPSV